MPLSVIILAAGKGTRMKSSLPKVLHPLAHKPMVQHVIDTASELKPDQIVVVIGHGANQVRQFLNQSNVIFVEQKQQLGTGHALQQCLDVIPPSHDVLVLYGDVPLTEASTLKSLIGNTAEYAVSILSFIEPDPTGYGRIVRNEADHVTAIVEEKDADDDIRQITECNSGIMAISGAHLRDLLAKLDNKNQQKEYYLTDVVKHSVSANLSVQAVICDDANEVLGVNNQVQLNQLESIRREKVNHQLMMQGVKMYDAARVDVRGSLTAGENVLIDINCVFLGDCKIGNNVAIGPNCVIQDATIGDNCDILPNSVIEQSVVGESSTIGPFARIRPETQLGKKTKVGNFVEIKKAKINDGSKVNHLTYIGDTTMGKNVNVGAGTITCNYDGAYKHQTIIGDDVFIGSDTQLIAPVIIRKGATIGAGSTITKEAPAKELTLSRTKQVTIKGWLRPTKNK